ncbi:hypothetical protein ACI798_19865 [Geodermatophilus sp. SYSU D01045]
MTVTVRPIQAADLPRVGEFLHRSMNSSLSPGQWARVALPTWPVESPNHGFFLDADGEVVGAHLAFYSERTLDGSTERICNLGAWCVEERYRFQGIRLLKAILAQDGYAFLDLSPSGNVVPLNERLGFTHLDTATALVPCLPHPSVPGRWQVRTGAAVAEVLSGTDLELYKHHAEAAAAHHVVLSRGDRHCYVVFRRDRRKGLPLFASLLYVGDLDLFRSGIRVFARHLLVRHRVLVLLAELRTVGTRPFPSVRVGTNRRKMTRGLRSDPERIDYLYSELTCVPW